MCFWPAVGKWFSTNINQHAEQIHSDGELILINFWTDFSCYRCRHRLDQMITSALALAVSVYARRLVY
jgi:hypothetical protein